VVKLDVRFIAASNKNLLQLIAKGDFREDLFYRLNVLPIEMPPLREKKNDIILLVNHFLESHSRNTGKPAKKISKEAAEVLIKYDWPGNVRELKNLIERLTTIIGGPVINHKDVQLLSPSKKETIHPMKLKEAVSIFEKNFITEIMEKVNFNKKEAADLLDIHRNTLVNKLNELGIKT